MSVNRVTGHGRNQVLLLENRAGSKVEVQRYCRKITHNRDRATRDTSAIGDKRIRKEGILRDSSLDMDGLWHPVMDDIVDNWLTFARDYDYSEFGTATGRELTSGALLGSSYEIEIDYGGEITFSASGEGHGAVTRGAN